MPSKSVGAEDLEKVKRVVFSFGRVQHRLSRRNLAPLATSTSATSSSSPTAALLVSIKPPSIVAQQVRKSEKRQRSEGASKEVKHSPSSDAPSAMSMSPAVDRRNARERNRVKLVNSGYDALRHRIPLAREDKKMSKVDILRSAVDYIRHLQWVIRSPSATNDDGVPNSHTFSDERIFSLDLNTCSSDDDDDNSMMESSTDCWPLSTSTLDRYHGCGSDKENVDVQGSPRHRHEMEGKKFPSPPPAAKDSSAPCSTTGGYHDQQGLAINQTMRPCFTALPPIHSVFSSFASVEDDVLLVDKTHDEGNHGYTEFQAFFDHHQLLNFSTSSSNNEEDSVSSTCNDVPGLIRTADHQPSSDEFRVQKDERQVPQNGSTHDAFVGVQQVAFSCF